MTVIINGDNLPTAGAVAFGNGSELDFGSAGTAGQLLKSNGTSAPSFTSTPAVTTISVAPSSIANIQATGAATNGIAISLTEVNIRADVYAQTIVGGQLAIDSKLDVGGEAVVGLGTSADVNTRCRIGLGRTNVAQVVYEASEGYATPFGGEREYGRFNHYTCNDAYTGFGYNPTTHFLRLDANGTAIGPAINNFFGADSAMQLAENEHYEIEALLFFTKTTAGTVTVTLTSSQAPQNVSGILQIGAIAGGTAIGAANQAALFNSTATGAAFGATGSLTTAVNHAILLKYLYHSHATLPPDVRINVTSSAGTVTPLRNSYYKVIKQGNAVISKLGVFAP